MKDDQVEKLYKAFGVLWKPYTNNRGNTFLQDVPLCPDEGCHTFLKQNSGQWFCVKCDKMYPCKDSYSIDREWANLMWEGHKTLNWEVYSLELPLTTLKAGDDDDNYWVKVKLGEKGGKRVAVIYFGEKINGVQDKNDYAQVFIDIENEQLRFDPNNKNPIKIMASLKAEFKDSIITQERKIS